MSEVPLYTGFVPAERPAQERRFRGGLVFKAHRLCVSLNSRLDSNKEDKQKDFNEVEETMPGQK